MKKHSAEAIAVVVAVIFSGILFSAMAQEKAKPEAAPKVPTALTIVRAVVGTGVENSEPVGASEKFPASTEKAYCFIEMTNIPKDTEVTFVWSQGGKELLKTNLPVKAGPRWRTYTYKNIAGRKGDWKVEIKDSEGKVLKDLNFKVE